MSRLVRTLAVVLFAALSSTSILAAQTADSSSRLTGVVVADSTSTPIANADIVLLELGRGTQTDPRGAFQIANIRPGAYTVVVRHIGYGQLETRVKFAAGATVNRRIVLDKIVKLGTVVVTDVGSGIPSFDENRKVGLGHFLTRADLAKKEGQSLSSVMAEMPGTLVTRGRGDNAWVASSRVKSGSNGPSSFDRALGAPRACYAQVYLDHILIYAGGDGGTAPPPLFNLNSMAVDQIEAVEYYAGPAELPLEYSKLNSQCGVLVVWTRLASPKDTTKPPRPAH